MLKKKGWNLKIRTILKFNKLDIYYTLTYIISIVISIICN